MMCVGLKGGCDHQTMAPNSQGYLMSCWQKCSSVFDSIWNPWSMKKSTQLQLVAEENSFVTEKSYLSYGLPVLQGESNDIWTTPSSVSAVKNMSNYLRPSFIGGYYTFNLKILPIDLMKSSCSGVFNKRSISVTLKPFSAMTTTSLKNIEAPNELMSECKKSKMQECVSTAHPGRVAAKLVDCRLVKQRNSNSSLAVSVIEIQRSETLNQELMNRKNRELKKCSKKRRRRQKKQNKCGANSLPNDQGVMERQGSITKPRNKCASDIGMSNSLPKRLKQFDGDCESLGDTDVRNEKSAQKCSNPFISFIMGHVSDSDNDSDFEDEADFTDVEICFTNTLNCLTVGVRSITLSPEDTKHSRADCTISIVNFSDVSPEVIEANRRWNRTMADVKLDRERITKVSFPKESEMTTILPVDIYDRKGEWERYALERFRFKKRIGQVQSVLAPILASHHREKIIQRFNIQT